MDYRYRAICAAIAWATLVAKFAVELTSGEHAGIAGTILHYASFFTHLSIVLVAIAFTAPLLAPKNPVRTFFEQPAPRAAIALYIAIVAIVHHVLLADLEVRQGWSAATNLMLHTIVPALYWVDWLIFAPKRPMLFRSIPYWLIYPAVYALWALIKGHMTGAYPYPFLNMVELGLIGVTINIVGFVALFSVGAAMFISLGRFFPEPLSSS